MERPYTFKDFLLRPRRFVSMGCDMLTGHLMWAIMTTTSMYCGVKLGATSNHAPEKAFVGERHWRGTS